MDVQPNQGGDMEEDNEEEDSQSCHTICSATIFRESMLNFSQKVMAYT